MSNFAKVKNILKKTKQTAIKYRKKKESHLHQLHSYCKSEGYNELPA